jgi:hypothetical protein
MTRTKIYRYVLVVLAILLIASLAGYVLLLRAFHLYEDEHPPSSAFVTGKCKTPGLVAHWTFDDITSDVAPDASPSANHGRLEVGRRPLSKLRHGLPAQTLGVRGKALQFAEQQWISAGNNDCFTAEQFTFAAWVWLEQTGNAPTIAGKAAWPHNGWWLMTTSKGPQANERYLDLGISWGSGRAHVQSGYQLPLREWHHIVLTVSNTRREVQFFVDGKPYGPLHTNVPTWLVNWDHDFVVGDYDGSARWPWAGKLDDVRFYNYVLPAAESAALYSGGPTRTDTAP